MEYQSPSLLGLGKKADCENGKDFVQYYQQRYFALAYPAGITPALIAGGDHGTFVIHYLDPANKTAKKEEVITFKDLKERGRFGHPLLGCTLWGPSYFYVQQHAYRESTKGLALNRLDVFMPRYGKDPTFMAYLKTHPEHAIRFKSGYGSVEELQIADAIYNKTLIPSFTEAIRELNQGTRLGCNINNKLGFHLAEGHAEEIQVFYKNLHIGNLKDAGTFLCLKESYKYLSSVVARSVPPEIRVR